MGKGVNRIKQVASERGLFRERDLGPGGFRACLDHARTFRIVKSHGHGVWSHYKYEPTRYELVQIRLKRAVFWGPSALWLLGETTKEPDELWIALSNNSHLPRTLPLDTIVIRTRSLERDVVTVRQARTLLDLRVHARERAAADVARSDLPSLVSRDSRPRRFELAPRAGFLSPHLREWSDWSPPNPPPGYVYRDREDWTVVSSISKTQKSRR